MRLKVKKEQGFSTWQTRKLDGQLETAITRSRQTNQEKALDNPNNNRAFAMLKILIRETDNLSEMARTLNKEGFQTSRGGKFTAKQVSILINRYKLKENETTETNGKMDV